MTDILLVGDDGSGSAKSGTGACIARTERFRYALEEAGLTVSVLSPLEGARGAAEIKRSLKERSFDCIVAISPFPAEAVVIADPDIPVWIDMNGTHPAEIQLQGNEDYKGRERLVRILALENSLLMRGDGFSTPSRRQALAVTGELLLLGRMGVKSSETVPVEPVPNCSSGKFEREDKSASSFRIISTGSFNQWFDEVTLFKALESVMEMNEKLEFVSTGGRVPFSPEKYDRFRKMVENSQFRDRFKLHGWIEYDKLLEIYRSASVAVYADIPVLESILGARTRVLDWIVRGIPVICTDGAEISEDISMHELGIVVPQQDYQALAEALMKLVLSPDLADKISANQEKWCSGEGSSENLFKPVVKWCENPVRISTKPTGKRTVPELNSFSYLKRIFKVLSADKGLAYAAYRTAARIFPFIKCSGGK